MTKEQEAQQAQYAKYVNSVVADQERYDKQQRLSDIGFCMPPITIRPEIISKQEFIRLTQTAKR